METDGLTNNQTNSSHHEKLKVCDDLKHALAGDIGDIVAKHEKLILHYYSDVQDRGKQSFKSAKMVANIGFSVLILTLVYTITIDALVHFKVIENTTDSLKVGGVGVVSGLLIEFIAGVNFLLYGRSMKQFNAFHICLERTHRYLIAYKIAEKMDKNKDETLENLVCIMANAPMIITQEGNNEIGKPVKFNNTKVNPTADLISS